MTLPAAARLAVVVDADPAFVDHTRAALPSDRIVGARTAEQAGEIVSAGGVSLVVLGPSFGDERGTAAAASLRQIDPSVATVLVADIVTNRILLAAMRAGVADVVDMPLTSDKLGPAIAYIESLAESIGGDAGTAQSTNLSSDESHQAMSEPPPAAIEFAAESGSATQASFTPVVAGPSSGVVPPSASIDEPEPAADGPAATAWSIPVRGEDQAPPLHLVSPMETGWERVATEADSEADSEAPSLDAAPGEHLDETHEPAPVSSDLAEPPPPPLADSVAPEPHPSPSPSFDEPTFTPVLDDPPFPPLPPHFELPVTIEEARPVTVVSPDDPPQSPAAPAAIEEARPVTVVSPDDPLQAPAAPAAIEEARPVTVVSPDDPPQDPAAPPGPQPGGREMRPARLDGPVDLEEVGLFPTDGAPSEEPRGAGRVVAVIAGKGGTGKSITATNVALALTLEHGEDAVIVVDADIQFGDVALLLQLDPLVTLADAVARLDELTDTSLDAMLLRHESGLRVLPAPALPTSQDLVPAKAIVELVERLKGMCDVVIIDTPPVFDEHLLTVLEAADEVLAVVEMDLSSVKNAKIVLKSLRSLNYPMERIRLVVNRANAKSRVDLAELERSLELRAFGSIPSDRLVPQSVNEGIPVVTLKPRSSVAKAFRALAETLTLADRPEHED